MSHAPKQEKKGTKPQRFLTPHAAAEDSSPDPGEAPLREHQAALHTGEGINPGSCKAARGLLLAKPEIPFSAENSRDQSAKLAEETQLEEKAVFCSFVPETPPLP